MKHLINREDYINEYLRISNRIENENELYEGLLGTVFGGLKMLFKKDWASIKCKNASVLTHLKNIDKSLTGYTMTKMQYSNECNNIRQNIADYFNDILDYKLLQIEKVENADKFIEQENKAEEENTEVNGVAKYLNLKDKTLLDSLKKYKENISTACKPNPKLREYADQMLNSVVVFVNNIVIEELEKKGADKEKLEKKINKLKEKEKELEEVRKKMDEEAKKAGEDALKKLSDERDKAMRKIGVNPIGAMSGDKAVDAIASQYSAIIDEIKNKELNEGLSVLTKNFSDSLKSDTYLGLQKCLDEIDWREDADDDVNALQQKLYIKVILYKIKSVFDIIVKNKDKFNEVPSASVQAMMVALSNVIIYGFIGDMFDVLKSDDRISILTKCAIDSDATIGFNLPLIDPKKPDNGNFFVSVMNQFKNEDISSEEIKDAIESLSGKEALKLKRHSPNVKGYKKEEVSEYKAELAKKYSPAFIKEFRQNISALFDLIIDNAKKIKDDAEKERKAAAAQAEEKSKKE